MAAIMLQTIPSFYTKFSEKSLFIFASTYEKKTLFVQTIRRVFLPACKYHIILLGNIQ